MPWMRRKLDGKPYYVGGSAYHPETKKLCKINHYGGFVCSRQCDERASLELEDSMPGHGYNPKRTLGCYARESLRRNWPEYYNY